MRGRLSRKTRNAGSGPVRARSTTERCSLGCERAALERQIEPLPYIDKRLGQEVDQRVLVIGRRRDAQPLGALRHSRIIDRLDIDAVLFEQQIGGLLAFL